MNPQRSLSIWSFYIYNKNVITMLLDVGKENYLAWKQITFDQDSRGPRIQRRQTVGEEGDDLCSWAKVSLKRKRTFKLKFEEQDHTNVRLWVKKGWCLSFFQNRPFKLKLWDFEWPLSNVLIETLRIRQWDWDEASIFLDARNMSSTFIRYLLKIKCICDWRTTLSSTTHTGMFITFSTYIPRC